MESKRELQGALIDYCLTELRKIENNAMKNKDWKTIEKTIEVSDCVNKILDFMDEFF